MGTGLITLIVAFALIVHIFEAREICRQIDGLYRDGSGFKVIRRDTIRTVPLFKRTPKTTSITMNTKDIFPIEGKVTSATEYKDGKLLIMHGNKVYDTQAKVDSDFGSVFGISDLETVSSVDGAAIIPERNAIRFIMTAEPKDKDKILELQIEYQSHGEDNVTRTYVHVVESANRATSRDCVRKVRYLQ